MFENHTVADNILLAAKAPRTVLATLFGEGAAASARRSTAFSTTTRLTDIAIGSAGSLSHGQKQWLEIGMLLAQDPKLLLVDEPVAGMTDAETAVTAELLREIARDHSVVVVEHDMAFVRELGVKVTVLHEGAVLAEGSLDQVSADERVDRSVSGAIADVERRNINLFYGAAQALRSVSLKAEIGRVTCVLGRNGVGKSSLLRAIVGQQPIAGGAIHGRARTSAACPHQRARRGIGYVPQGREIFPLLTVRENLLTGLAPSRATSAFIEDGSSACFRCCARCWAGAAAISRAASSSSSRSAARSSRGRNCWCSTSRPRASSPRSSRTSAAPSSTAPEGRDGDRRRRAIFRMGARHRRRLRGDGPRRRGARGERKDMVETEVRKRLSV